MKIDTDKSNCTYRVLAEAPESRATVASAASFRRQWCSGVAQSGSAALGLASDAGSSAAGHAAASPPATEKHVPPHASRFAGQAVHCDAWAPGACRILFFGARVIENTHTKFFVIQIGHAHSLA